MTLLTTAFRFKEVYKKSMKMSELVELCLGGKTVFNSVISVMEFKLQSYIPYESPILGHEYKNEYG